MQPLSYLKRFLIPCKENHYRPRILGRTSLLLFLGLVIASEGLLITTLIARQTNIDFLAAVVPSEVIALTNSQREVNKVGDVAPNDELTVAAQAKAEDMAKKGYFSHNGPDGKTPWQWISESGYRYQYAGENLAVRFIDSSEVVNAWMQSPSHRANIVKPVYSQIGVGVAQGLYDGSPATYVVQYFAAPFVAAPESNASAPVATPVAVAPAVAPQVAGAQTAASPNSVQESIFRQFVRALSEPKNLSNWILGVVAAILLVALALNFFIRLQIQAASMSIAGVLVLALAVSFLTLNLNVKEGGLSLSALRASQPASVVSSGQTIVGEDGAQVGYSLFP